MYTVLITLIVIAAVLLVLIVLVQNSKGGGLASNLSAGTQFGGVAEQKSKLEKYTWGLVIIMAVLSIVASVSNGGRIQDREESGVREIMTNQNVIPQVPTTTAPTMQPGE
ncbi:MAG: preprotein translocase subunit SecG [Bacteroidales bacterium]|jgi:preprotein translocase subunit SecG|nr:preprotein translocase subunit SecG [Bacteroidales bacterium]